MLSKITDKFQTTVPKQVRERLRLTRRDVLDWSFQEGILVVRPSGKPLLKLRGCIRTGPGDISKDIRKARDLRAGRYS